MQEMIEKHLDAALHEFSQGDYYNSLIAAKDLYFTKTGKIDDEDPQYESKMSAFNEWYLFQYRLPTGKTPLTEYLEQHKLDESLSHLFFSMVFSVYEYKGVTFFKKKYLFKNLYTKESFTLPAESNLPIFLEKDLFVGRVLHFHDQYYLLPGVSIVPRGVKRIIARRIKILKKLNDTAKTLDFIFKIIYFRNKWSHYKHVRANRIFNFS